MKREKSIRELFNPTYRKGSVDPFYFKAIFGFFHIDATFSAAFVMILTAIFNTACEISPILAPSPGLGDAVEILRYLSDHGNLSAIERAPEIEHIWTRLHLDDHMPSGL